MGGREINGRESDVAYALVVMELLLYILFVVIHLGLYCRF